MDLADELLGAKNIEARPRHVEHLGQEYDNPEVKGRPLRMIMNNEEIK